MRRLLNLLFTIVLLIPCWGQQPIRFDTVQFGPVSYAIGYGVFEVDSGYRVFDVQKFNGTPFQDLVVTGFNIGGGQTSAVHFITHQADWIGSSSPVVAVDEGYVSGVARFGAGEIDSLFLYRFDTNGDTLWTKFIDADTTFLMRGTAVTSSGDVLLAGLHAYPEEAYVYHLDNEGNIKGYHGYPGFDGEDVVEGMDGSWFVGGRGNQLNNYNHPVLVRSDSTGEELWRRTLADKGRYASLVALRDGGVLGLGIVGHEPDSGGFCLAIKYDTSGVVVWRQDVLRASSPIWPSNFNAGFENADSTIIAAGWLRTYAERDQGVIMKFAYDGSVLWSRSYSHYPGAAYGKDQIFWDVKPTSDGGMVLTGETNSDDYPYAQLWLLKLDSMGCLVPGCGNVGVQEYTDLYNGKLLMAPNPTSDVINLSLELPEGNDVQGAVQALLLDATGRLVTQQNVHQHFNALRASMDVSKLPAGTYYLHLRDAKRWLAGSKVVVQ